LTELQRYLKLDLPPGQSAFLWGARKAGKSTFLKHHFPNSVYYDLLDSKVYLHPEPLKLQKFQALSKIAVNI
jgi:predicted kinase